MTVSDYLPSRFWLMKTEPDVFSIQDLQKRPRQEEMWDGVRNYLARNFMMNEMKVGDKVLFYHSNAEPSGVAGTAEVVKAAQPDPSAFDKKSKYYDEKSKKEKPTWFCITVGKPKPFKTFVPLAELREHATLKGMLVLQKGQRLSILPVSQKEFETICKLGS